MKATLDCPPMGGFAEFNRRLDADLHPPTHPPTQTWRTTMHRLTVVLLGLVLCTFTPPLPAKSLGVMGHVFPIGEIDMLDWIDQRLRTFEQNGETEAMKNRMQQQVRESVRRPKPVTGLTTTISPKTYFVDPTLTLARDTKDSAGQVLFPSGTRINALDSRTWPQAERRALPQFTYSKQLVLFDGDDPPAAPLGKELPPRPTGQVDPRPGRARQDRQVARQQGVLRPGWQPDSLLRG